MTPIGSKQSAGVVERENDAQRTMPSERPAVLAPPPNGPLPTDDLQTAIAVLMIENMKEQRATSDRQRGIAAKAQEEAQSRKIAQMREIADETFAQGLAEGFTQLASAGLQARSAVVGYGSAVADMESKVKDSAKAAEAARDASKLARDAKLLDAASRAVSAAGTIGSNGAKSEIEHDRANVAVTDREIDRARSAADGAASDSKRAQDDIRETMGFIRQYLATKAQLNQASIIRG